MFACSLTIKTHPPELIALLLKLMPVTRKRLTH